MRNAEPYNSPNESETKTSPLFDRIVGSANESTVYINGVETSGLIDTGSMITTVSESFYKSLSPLPHLHDMTDVGLSIQGANGQSLHLEYKGYIESELSAPLLSNCVFNIPLLVVSDMEYNRRVPIIVGTNVIRLGKAQSSIVKCLFSGKLRLVV